MLLYHFRQKLSTCIHTALPHLLYRYQAQSHSGKIHPSFFITTFLITSFSSSSSSYPHFFLPPPLFCLCLKHLCQLCLALLLSSSFSHCAWLESFHLHLHPAPLNLLACPEGSLLLTQCTISLQTTDTGCKYIYTDSA